MSDYVPVVPKVKSKLALSTTRKSLKLLEGAFQSAHKGRSFNFDELRGYRAGDEVRDIDWRASAKHEGPPLVKQFIADKQHNIFMLIDTSVNMLGAGEDYAPKIRAGLFTLGLLGFLGVQAGNPVGAVLSSSSKRVPYRHSESHLEYILKEAYSETLTKNPPTDFANIFKALPEVLNEKAMILILANTIEMTPEIVSALKALQHKNDVFWVSVSDLNPLTVPAEFEVVDVWDSLSVPAGLREEFNLMEDIIEEEQRLEEQLRKTLRELSIPRFHIEDENGATEAVFNTLFDISRAKGRLGV